MYYMYLVFRLLKTISIFSHADAKALKEHICLTKQRKSEWMLKIQMLNKSLNQEQDLHQDIVFVDVVDVYRNLPIKMFLFLKWYVISN